MSDSDDSSPLAKMIAAGAMLVMYGIYHFCATENQTIRRAKVTNKHKEYRLVRRNKRTVLETDYYIETDKGTFKDESDIFNGEFVDGDDYNDIVVGETYDIEANKDNVFGTYNVISAKPSPTSW